MAKQIIDQTRQYIEGSGITDALIGRFVSTGTGTGQGDFATDFPVRISAPGAGDTPSALAGVLLTRTTQGAEVGTKGLFKVAKVSTLSTITIGHGVATVNAAGEILTATATGHGDVKLVEGDDVWIEINLPV